MAFVVVQHLSPPHKSILPEIIQRFTAMPVAQVTDGIPVEPNRVYVIPPGSDLALSDGHLRLDQTGSWQGYRLPIDFFFRSLARGSGRARHRHRALRDRQRRQPGGKNHQSRGRADHRPGAGDS